MTLPPHARATAQRILDRAAERLLAERLNANTVSAPPGQNDRPPDRAAN